MTLAAEPTPAAAPPPRNLAIQKPTSLLGYLYQRETREVIFQVVLVVAIVSLFWMIISNTATNLKARNIASGFGFLNNVAGFDIAQSVIEYSNTSTYLRAFYVGLWNTIIVAVIGIFFATIVGFTVGIARLSSNWLISKLAAGYVEIVRNCPLLLQMFLWYFAVLKQLPEPLTRVDGVPKSTSWELPLGMLLNTRGLFMPKPEWLAGSSFVLYALIAGIIGSVLLARWAKARQMATGQIFPVFFTSLALIIGLPLLVFLLMGRPVQFEFPTLGRFNLSGGTVVQPEFFAVLLGLVFYTAAYIAEIVRAGIVGVSKGQKEAANAIGLTKGQTLRLVVIPQAMRIIIPPLTSNYLNLTKNSSLAGAIGYPDLTQVMGTINNQTGQAVETILSLMAVYLLTSLLTSAFMNWFNARMALVER
jgi:general L-amino acid transport system permease protein